MKITVEVKTVYGQQKVYPACEKSQLFATIAQNATLTDRVLNLIKKMGVEIEVKQAEVKI